MFLGNNMRISGLFQDLKKQMFFLVMSGRIEIDQDGFDHFFGRSLVAVGGCGIEIDRFVFFERVDLVGNLKGQLAFNNHDELLGIFAVSRRFMAVVRIQFDLEQLEVAMGCVGVKAVYPVVALVIHLGSQLGFLDNRCLLGRLLEQGTVGNFQSVGDFPDGVDGRVGITLFNLGIT